MTRAALAVLALIVVVDMRPTDSLFQSHWNREAERRKAGYRADPIDRPAFVTEPVVTALGDTQMFFYPTRIERYRVPGQMRFWLLNLGDTLIIRRMPR